VRVVVALLVSASLLSDAVFADQTIDRAPTLAEALQGIGAPLDGISADVGRTRITSFSTGAADDAYAIAYWAASASSILAPPLYLGIKEQGRPWRIQAVGLLSDFERGSITKLNLTSTHMFVGVHLSPSAVHTIVLTRELARAGGFDGWWMSGIPGGPIVYQGSMVHFAPAHAAELATFDPITGRDAPLYPTDSNSPARAAYVAKVRPLMAEWERREPGLVYGYRPELFNVGISDLRYEPGTETLTFTARFESRYPSTIAAPTEAAVTVTCRPMRTTARKCIESQ
jgi:hypothetical protein